MFYYSRSSSPRQNENYQVDEALSLGIDERNIFIDKASGKNFERPQYQALKQCLRKGDLLYIHALSRLTRGRPNGLPVLVPYFLAVSMPAR